MGIERKQKFDGYAEKYDEWFMKNENLALVKGSKDSAELWKNLVKVTRYAVK